MAGLSGADWVEALKRMATEFERQLDYLSRLDSVLGDGDHGVSMTRAFRSVMERLASVQGSDIGTIAGMVGSSLVGLIGGATGPLFGTVFLRLAQHARGRQEVGVAELAQGLRAALDGVKAIGKAEVGEKTMVDALTPAVEALERSAREGAPMGEALDRAAAAAEEGARSTTAMKATRGRARYLGERSIGHQDPGATSFALIMKALAEAYHARHAPDTT